MRQECWHGGNAIRIIPRRSWRAAMGRVEWKWRERERVPPRFSSAYLYSLKMNTASGRDNEKTLRPLKHTDALRPASAFFFFFFFFRFSSFLSPFYCGTPSFPEMQPVFTRGFQKRRVSFVIKYSGFYGMERFLLDKS